MLSEEELWIYFDGPEPARIRPLLDALREAAGPMRTKEERLLALRRSMPELEARIDRMLERERQAGAEREAAPVAPPEARLQLREPDAGPDSESEPGSPSTGDVPAPSPVLEPPSPVRAPAALLTTAPLDLAAELRRAVLPFQPAQAAAAKPEEGSARTVRVPVMRSPLGGTTPVGDDSISKAVAAVPFAGAAATSVVAFPNLTLEQAASMAAELFVTPQRAAEILKAYQVPSEAARRALEEHWQARLAARPEERAAFQEAYGVFVRYLQSRSR